MVTVFIMKFLILSCLLVLCLAGEVCLPKGWVLTWDFSGTGTIDFTLTIDQHSWLTYQWVGIGFKYTDEEEGMTGADINNIILNEMPEDRFAEYNGMPVPDIEYDGGQDNIQNASLDNLVYSWSRPVDSGDGYDKIYVQDAEMRVLWACGKVMNGVQMKHMVGDRDVTTVVLSNDYSSDCADSFLQLN